MKTNEDGSRIIDLSEFIKNKNIGAPNNARQIDILSQGYIHPVEEKIITDGQVESDKYLSRTWVDQDPDISYEEFKRLYFKQQYGEELTVDELKALRSASPVYAEDLFNEMREQEQTSGGGVLKPTNPFAAGFTFKSFALYFIVSAILIFSIIAILLLG